MVDKESPSRASSDQTPVVVDPFNVPVLFVDWIVTGGVNYDVLNIELGTIDHSLKRAGDEMPRIVMAARLRCTRDFAVRFHAALGDLLGLPPQLDKESGEPAPKPPSNRIN